jgi:hypothetical protein
MTQARTISSAVLHLDVFIATASFTHLVVIEAILMSPSSTVRDLCTQSICVDILLLSQFSHVPLSASRNKHSKNCNVSHVCHCNPTLNICITSRANFPSIWEEDTVLAFFSLLDRISFDVGTWHRIYRCLSLTHRVGCSTVAALRPKQNMINRVTIFHRSLFDTNMEIDSKMRILSDVIILIRN